MRGSTRHADQSIKQACLCREVSTDQETHGHSSGRHRRAGAQLQSSAQKPKSSLSKTREAWFHPCVSVCVCVCLCLFVFVCVCSCFLSWFVLVCVFVCLCVCVFVFVFVVFFDT